MPVGGFGSQSSPWGKGLHRSVFFFLPIVLKQWLPQGAARQVLSQAACWKSPISCKRTEGRRIGLVWSAGRHKAPQPERSARVRDVPRQAFFELAQIWRERYQATLVSMQLEGHDEQPVRSLDRRPDLLEQPLHSPDWLQTAEVLESIDLLVSVDTSVAHLAGALGIPTVLMLPQRLRWARPFLYADWRWGQATSAS